MNGSGADPPTAAQDTLLRATFLSGDRGIRAWRSWKSTVDLDDHLDLASFRLLPELARRLRERGIEAPMLDRFAGISRKHWLANRLLFHDLEELTEQLRGREVGVMVPAELALALVHYPDHPLAPRLNCAVLVRDHQAVTAFGVLEAAGWVPTPRISASLLDQYVSARSWHPFRGPGDRHLRLQWHVLPQRATRAVDREYWSRAADTKLGNTTVAVPSPIDQLVQLCTQRAARRMNPLFIRAVDVMLLVTACPDRIEWDRLLVQAAEPGLILPIRETLGYLQDRLDEPVPVHVFAQVQKHAVSRLERWEYKLTTTGASRWSDLLTVWFDYRRTSATNVLASAARFPRFLQQYLKLPYLWQVPFRTLARTSDNTREWTDEGLTHPQRDRNVPISGK